jgi:hypothetical protein
MGEKRSVRAGDEGKIRPRARMLQRIQKRLHGKEEVTNSAAELDNSRQRLQHFMP